MEENPLPTFSQDLFLVTGGSGGIGRAVAGCLARRGARVLVNGRDPLKLAETVASLPGTGHAAAPFPLADMDLTSAWIGELVKAHGPLRGVVHSAGINSGYPLRVLKQAHLSELMKVNVDAALGLLKGFRQRGAHGPKGSVVLVTSVMGVVGAASKTAYCSAKGALVALARAAALELGPEDIRVNCVAPGYVETEMLARLQDQLTEGQFEHIRALHPLGFGKPEDVAEAVAFLLSESARWITGTTLVVDGGYSAQ